MSQPANMSPASAWVWRILGGVVYFGILAAVVGAWMGQSWSSATGGVLVGGRVVLTSPWRSTRFRSGCSAWFFPDNTRTGRFDVFKTGFWRGVDVARFTSLFLAVPFLVLCSFAVGLFLFLASLVLSGPATAVTNLVGFAHGAFWFSGLCVDVGLWVAFAFWMVQFVVRGRKRYGSVRRHREASIPNSSK